MSTVQPLDKFRRKAQSSSRLLEKQFQLRREGRIGKRELYQIAEASFLSCFVALESFMEEELIDSMFKETCPRGLVRTLLRPRSRAHAKKVILVDGAYFQPFPYNKLLRVAEIYLKDARPFSLLPPQKINSIERGRYIRNHIAHGSDDSREKYKRFILSNVRLPHKSYQPGLLLTARFSRQQTYFDHYVSEFLGVAAFISAS